MTDTTDTTADGQPRSLVLSHGLEDLAAQNPTPDHGVTPHLTYEGAGFRVRHLAFDEGATLPEHTAPLPVVITVVQGRVAFRVDGAEHDLRQGAVIHLDRDVPHEVTAREPSRLVLTLVGR